MRISLGEDLAIEMRVSRGAISHHNTLSSVPLLT